MRDDIVVIVGDRLPQTVAEFVHAHPEIGPILDVIAVRAEDTAKTMRLAMESHLMLARTCREIDLEFRHPKWSGKEQPRSPRQSFRKSSKR